MSDPETHRSHLGPNARHAFDLIILHIERNSLPLPAEHSPGIGDVVLDFVAPGGVLSLLFHGDWVQFVVVGNAIEGRTKVTVEPGKEWKIVDRFELEFDVLNEIGGFR